MGLGQEGNPAVKRINQVLILLSEFFQFDIVQLKGIMKAVILACGDVGDSINIMVI